MGAIGPGSLIGTGIGFATGIPGLGLVGGLLDSFMGGGGKTTSVLNGTRVKGQLTASGFQGDSTSFDQLGHTWATDYGGNYGTNASAAFTGNLNNTYPDLAKRIGDKTIPIDFVSGPEANSMFNSMFSLIDTYNPAPPATTAAAAADTTAPTAPSNPADTAATVKAVAASPVIPIPDDKAVQEAARRKLALQNAGRTNRANTLLSDNTGDLLGG